MSGHSHASNVKHKKDRNDRAKSELFLKIRKKIQFAYNLDGDREKAFTLAREHNFPKEKVYSIIEKVELLKAKETVALELLYTGKFEILIYLTGILSESNWQFLEEKLKLLDLEKMNIKQLAGFFEKQFLLCLSGCEDPEELVLSSLSGSVINKINKIEKKFGPNRLTNFEIFFSEGWARSEALRAFVDKFSDLQWSCQDLVNPISPVELTLPYSLEYFKLLKTELSVPNDGLQMFTNVFNSDHNKRDHSSVG